MECASAWSPLWLPQPRILSSAALTFEIHPPPLPHCLHLPHPKFDCDPFFEMMFFACCVLLVWCECTVVPSEFVPGSEHSDAPSEMTAQSSAGVWVNTLQLIWAWRSMPGDQSTISSCWFWEGTSHCEVTSSLQWASQLVALPRVILLPDTSNLL